MNFRKLKVLHEEVNRLNSWCDSYYKNARETIDQHFGSEITFIEPIVNRDGFYYCRINKLCWFEWRGFAFTNPKFRSMFLYDLDRLNEVIYSSEELLAMKFLLNKNKVPKQIKTMLKQAIYDAHNRKVLRDISLNGVRVAKRFKAFKTKNKEI